LVEADIARKLGVTLTTGQRYFQEMLDYLHRSAASEIAPPPPSDEVDLAWHTFILHTRAYTDYCNEVFGGYVHHEPDADDPHDVIDRARERLTNCSPFFPELPEAPAIAELV